MSTTPAPLMLGVSGCRGIVGASLTPTVVVEFAGSFASWLAARSGGARPRALLAADGRAGYHAVHAAARAGLLAAGCDVIDAGICATPTAGVMVDHLAADAGVILTASHNPQNWNGMKFLLGAGGPALRAGLPTPSVPASSPQTTHLTQAVAAAPDAATAQAIIAHYKSGGARRLANWDAIGSATTTDVASAVHIGLVLRSLDALRDGARPTVTDRIRAAHFTVVLDSVNGAGRHAGRVLLERLGCIVIALGDADTGIFWHPAEPTRDNLAQVSKQVATAGAAIGFCQDPDADRLALLAADGSYIGEEYTLALATRAVLELGRSDRPGSFGPVAGSESRPTLAANLSTSRMIDDIAAASGARVVRTAVGEANVVAAMKRHHAPIGGEGNGGVIWPAVTYVRDSLGSMGLVLALMALTGKSLQQLIAEIPPYAIEKRKLDIPSKGAARPACDAALRHFTTGPGHRGGARADTQDGVRIDLELSDGPAWVHIRASNTEPIMRLIAEARSSASATALLDETAGAIG